MALYGALTQSSLEARVSVHAAGLTTDLCLEAQELSNAANALSTKYLMIPAYDLLGTSDQAWWDIAVGALTAIRLIGQLVILNNQGAAKVKLDEVTVKLLDVPSMTEQTKWADEARDALMFISSLRATLKAKAKRYDMFFVGGSTRGPCDGELGLIDISYLLPVGWGLLTGSIWGVDDAGVALANFGGGTFYP